MKKDFLIPVYYASVLENNGSGVPIVRIFANDSDLQENGNGLVLFHIPRKRNQRELFTIDSKEGVITTLTSLDYEEEPVHNITVLASDLGKPSLTSTALVIVDVVDMQEPADELSSPIFAHRYYELEVSTLQLTRMGNEMGCRWDSRILDSLSKSQRIGISWSSGLDIGG